jgi:nucleoside-diphosphate-sugar epimerase
VGSYGASKAAAEMVCREWSRETHGVALVFRLGNVVGAGCRGLIPYLVAHALRHPGGERPARIRGGGALVRDYVPVRHTAAVLLAAAGAPFAPGAFEVFNVGTGRPLTNGEVTAQVRGILERHGLKLRVESDAPPVPGEAREVVLDPEDTYARFGVAPPRPGDVDRAVEEAVLHLLAPPAESAARP